MALRPRDGVAPLLQRPGRRECLRRERVAPAAERDAPFRHRARRIGRQRRVEALDRALELERVEQRDGTIELRLRRGAARGGKQQRCRAFRVAS